MQNMISHSEENARLLEEIMMIPSSSIEENRFTGSDVAAACNGKCVSGGGCKSFIWHAN